ncbi:MAG: TolC family protein [Bacteroidia bacterium]
MNRIITYGLWFIFLLPVPRLVAQELKYNLEECISYAIENNKTIQNARFDEYISKASVKEILALGYPQISGSADLQYFVELPTSILPGIFNPQTDPVTGQPIIDPETGQPVPGPPIALQFGFPWNANAGVSVNQLVADGTYFIGLQASRTFVELAEKNTDRTREEVAISVSKAYYQALIAGEQMNLLDANIARVEKLFEETRALNEQGFVEKIDVDRLEINFTNLKLEKARLRRYADLSMNLLKFQMGLPISAELSLAEDTEALKAKPVSPLEAADFQAENRIEYSILQTSHALETYNMRRYRAGYYPSLYAFGSYQWNAQRSEFNIFSGNEKWYPISVVGLQLNVPIFDGFKKRQQVQQSMLALRKIENNFDILKQSIALEVSNAHAALLNAHQTLETSERNRELARKVYEVSQIKYREGVGSSLEVNEAESQLKQAESAYLNGLFEFFMAKTDLQKARGEFSRYHQD